MALFSYYFILKLLIYSVIIFNFILIRIYYLTIMTLLL